jgi:hypothetical protein
MDTYTLVINGDRPAIGADTDVYLQTEGIQAFAGKVDSVLFKGNALADLENLEMHITQMERVVEAAKDLLNLKKYKVMNGKDEHYMSNKEQAWLILENNLTEFNSRVEDKK